ncbi:MAG: HAD family hydrolase [Sphingobacteriales bacterium]
MHIKKNRRLIIFDLDDTLVNTSDVYWVAKSSFIDVILKNTQLSTSYIDNLFEEIDTENLLKFGHSPKRYGKTMLDVYKYLLNEGYIQSKNKVENQIVEAGEIIIKTIPSLLPGAIDLLEWCKTKFTLALVTRGEDELQSKKIQYNSLHDYFDLIKVVKEKSDSDFLSIIETLHFQIKDTWIVGDSLKSEIETGLRIGANCIYFKYEHPLYNWVQERNYSLLSSSFYYEVNELKEIPFVLNDNLRKAAV